MSLQSVVDAITASAINPLHPNVFSDEGEAGFQLSIVGGVKRNFYRSWFVDHLICDCPGLPTTVGFFLHEQHDSGSDTDPLIRIDGFVAVVARPPPFLGTGHWLWMATLSVRMANNPPVNVHRIHMQYKGTNVGSIGFIRYPFTE